MSDCPRCTRPLVAAQVDTYAVRLCQACRGVLARHREVIEIIDRSWRSIPAPVAAAAEFVKPVQADPPLRCPDCRQRMEQYGYMGLAAVTIDRCDKCALLWLDAEELQNMLLALAQANYRSEQRRQAESAAVLPLHGSLAPVTEGEEDLSRALTSAQFLLALLR